MWLRIYRKSNLTLKDKSGATAHKITLSLRHKMPAMWGIKEWSVLCFLCLPNSILICCWSSIYTFHATEMQLFKEVKN